MKKNLSIIFTIILIVLLYTSCSSFNLSKEELIIPQETISEKEDIISQKTIIENDASQGESDSATTIQLDQVQELNFIETDVGDEKVKHDLIKIPITANSEISSFCIYNNTMYYSIDYLPYFDDPTGEKGNLSFEDKYNTVIRAYNIADKSDKLIYSYDLDYAIAITNIQCNGDYIVWEDYPRTETNLFCTVKKMKLNEDSLAETIFSYGDMEGEISNVTLTLTGNCILKLPNEYYNVINDISITCKKDDENTIMNISGEKIAPFDLEVVGEVSNPMCNGSFIIWAEGYDAYDRNQLYFYDIKNQITKKIVTPYFFSYAFLGDYVLVNQDNGMYCYDIRTEECFKIWEGDTMEFIFTFQGLQNNTYTEWIADEADYCSVVNFYVEYND